MSRLLALFLTCCLLLSAAACTLGSDGPEETPDPPPFAVGWEEADDAPFPGTVTGEVGLPATGAAVLTVKLANARFTAVPEACATSPIVSKRSWISIDHSRLACALPASEEERTVTLSTVAASPDGSPLSGTVRLAEEGQAPEEVALPELDPPDSVALTPRLRLLSSPDFLNTDIADLGRGPGLWDPSRSENSTNPAHERTLDAILADWASMRPDGVLVAGDLVNGRWGRDEHDTGNFGPTDTYEQSVLALQRAARTYYPQWLQRFTDHDLAVFPAPGDHEYGDNPWPARKRALVPTFREEFAAHFTLTPDGEPVWADRPEGPAELTAYAGRPLPDVQVVSLDLFDLTPERERIGLDEQQRDWLRSVLERAQRDGVEWIIVQGHVPVLTPVRVRGSSGLTLPGGERSRLWQLFEEYGVDLYLAGEAHDVTVSEAGGVTQVVHGGLYQYGLTNGLVLDLYDDFFYLTLRDYDIRYADAEDGSRLWETRRTGVAKSIRIVGRPFTIGTAAIDPEEGLQHESGLLVPWKGGGSEEAPE